MLGGIGRWWGRKKINNSGPNPAEPKLLVDLAVPKNPRRDVSVDDLIGCIQSSPEYGADMEGLAIRLPGSKSLAGKLTDVAEYVLTEKQIWYETGNENPKYQDNINRQSGVPTLFLDEGNRLRNETLAPADYLSVMKAYMQKWASRKNTDSSDGNWYKMQDELAREIAKKVSWYRSIKPAA